MECSSPFKAYSAPSAVLQLLPPFEPMPTGVPAAATGRTGVLPEMPGTANAEALEAGMPATARARAISRSASAFGLPASPGRFAKEVSDQ